MTKKSGFYFGDRDIHKLRADGSRAYRNVAKAWCYRCAAEHAWETPCLPPPPMTGHARR